MPLFAISPTNASNPRTGALSGCLTVTTANVSAFDLLTVQSIQSSRNNFRWRAGNLAQRQAAGSWIRSKTSPPDRFWPMEVQNNPVFDGDEPPQQLAAPIEYLVSVWQ